ncbi:MULTISPECIES: hypothetical protein [unclassified Paenibacillus]|jgi:hypothetical protein|uniref:hypothetical protein n=1 Tax=unclassified Paenibacillus TaxID=185978 RepID=UPI00119E02DB|nr:MULTISPECIES: hypothetical protein [Paenibacillaceae]
MIGTIRWNAIIGGLGAAATFISSFSNNILTTTLLRTLYSFVILFALVFVFRWVLGTVMGGTNPERDSADSQPEDSVRGQRIDFTTPDEPSGLSGEPVPSAQDDREQDETGFSPLNPPKLATRNKVDSEEMVKALRHLSED